MAVGALDAEWTVADHGSPVADRLRLVAGVAGERAVCCIEREAGVAVVIEADVPERGRFVVAACTFGAARAFGSRPRELPEVRVVVARRAVLGGASERSAERVRFGGPTVACGACGRGVCAEQGVARPRAVVEVLLHGAEAVRGVAACAVAAAFDVGREPGSVERAGVRVLVAVDAVLGETGVAHGVLGVGGWLMAARAGDRTVGAVQREAPAGPVAVDVDLRRLERFAPVAGKADSGRAATVELAAVGIVVADSAAVRVASRESLAERRGSRAVTGLAGDVVVGTDEVEAGCGVGVSGEALGVEVGIGGLVAGRAVLLGKRRERDDGRGECIPVR